MLILVGIGIFIFTRGGNTKGRAKYTAGVAELEYDGTKYVLINDVTDERTVGSQIRSFVHAEKDEKIAEIKSMGVLTMASLYKVKRDAAGVYLVDNAERVYARADIADGLKQSMKSGEALPKYRVFRESKDADDMLDITKETADAVLSAAEAADAIDTMVLKDRTFVTDYSNRREIYRFSEDGALYSAVAELFLYEGTVFVTVRFEGDRNVNRDQTLYGVRLPEELQATFRGLWPQ